MKYLSSFVLVMLSQIVFAEEKFLVKIDANAPRPSHSEIYDLIKDNLAK